MIEGVCSVPVEVGEAVGGALEVGVLDAEGEPVGVTWGTAASKGVTMTLRRMVLGVEDTRRCQPAAPYAMPETTTA